MKILAIGDVHGRDLWKKAVDKEEWDKIVFIGDYWDSYDLTYNQTKANFLDIVHFKRNNPDRVVLLLGNHDFHYTPFAISSGERYSRYSSFNDWKIRDMLQENKDIFQAAYLEKDHLFTHAGVTNVWLERVMKYRKDDPEKPLSDPIDEYINQTWNYAPGLFSFCGVENHGDDPTQGPFWVRPQSLNEHAHGDYIQVVGHTPVNGIAIEPFKFSHNGGGLFIDCPGEFLVIENNKYRKIILNE